MTKRAHRPLAPDTTVEDDMVTAGQRAVNLIWESTQSQIAKVTVYANILIIIVVIVGLVALKGQIGTELIAIILAALGSINTTTGIIIGFYFSRTNHQSIGGVGKKPQDDYKGR